MTRWLRGEWILALVMSELHSNVNFRPAEVKDAAALTTLALRSKAHWGYDADFMAACVDELTVTAEHIVAREIWLVEADPKSSLIACYELVSGVTDDGAAEVRLFFVDPAAIGTGLGRKLWTHLEDRARIGGVTSLELDSDPFAMSFYEHMGCRVIGSSPSGSIPGRDLPRMRKWLKPEAGL